MNTSLTTIDTPRERPSPSTLLWDLRERLLDWVAQRRVVRGMKLLDEKGPTGWREQIERDLLDINDWNACVLGQVYGHYEYGEKKLAISWDFDALKCGFRSGMFIRGLRLRSAWLCALAE